MRLSCDGFVFALESNGRASQFRARQSVVGLNQVIALCVVLDTSLSNMTVSR